MKLQFDPNQDYQLEAIDAICDLFEGQPRADGLLRFEEGSTRLAAIANRLDLTSDALLANLQAVQARGQITPDGQLATIDSEIEAVDGRVQVSIPNFSVEMETGTGKTYVYLRSILEMERRYGFRKYIVVVPSLAIREGVLKSLSVTENHLRSIFDNVVYRYYAYDSDNLTTIRQFSQSDAVEVMVMTIDSFNKAANIIRRHTDRLQGETPIHLLQAARPIVILDEPQNMESEKSIEALALLNPLVLLRFSATHRNPYNLIYRMTPATAYERGLVKKIEVSAVVQDDDANRAFVRVDDITATRNAVTARLAVHMLQRTGQVRERVIRVKYGDSLEEKTGRVEYADYVVDEIHPTAGYVRFRNNVEVALGASDGDDRAAIFAEQIRQTVQEHLRKQERLRAHGIKVLSLFFVDRVANYIGDAEQPGLIRQLFDRAFEDAKVAYPEWRDLTPTDVQAAYFAEKGRRGGVRELLDSSSGEAEADVAAYDLIMRDKEALLSFPAPDDDDETRARKQVAFIFSHSALREGWDNPNVFQICTLNQSISMMRKRQEIGRGLRLCVDQGGDRVHDERLNVLTVIANESYRTYVKTLQSEIATDYRAEIEARYGKPVADLSDEDRLKIAEEYGEGILPPPPRRAGHGTATLRKARVLSEEFADLWRHISPRTRYSVRIDSPSLIEDVLPSVERARVAAPRITVTKAVVGVDREGVFEALQMSAARTAASLADRYPLPNMLELIANLLENTTPPVRLTRRTLLEVFRRANNNADAATNPHEWATAVARLLKEKLADHLVAGIQYTKTGEQYELTQILEDEIVELFSRYAAETPEDSERSIYDLIACDSSVEAQFVEDMEAREDVRLYVKLPNWFVVPTPVGEYNPDWAVLMDGADEDRPVLYLVSETKSDPDPDKLRPNEWRKIQSGAAHFGSAQLGRDGALDDVDYKVVQSAAQLP